MLNDFEATELTSLVLKRVPPRCTSTVLLDMLDATGGDYDFVHLPYDIQHHKNLSLAFVNFLDHETAREAFVWLSTHTNFPQGLAPSTQVHWGQIHGLGPNLAHFIARFGIQALDPPYAPYVFLDGNSIARTRDIVTIPGGKTFGCLRSDMSCRQKQQVFRVLSVGRHVACTNSENLPAEELRYSINAAPSTGNCDATGGLRCTTANQVAGKAV